MIKTCSSPAQASASRRAPPAKPADDRRSLFERALLEAFGRIAQRRF